MSEQLQLRRGTAAQVAAFTPAAGEVVVDTTNNRLVVGDGATAGGFAAAKLSEVTALSRTAVIDANYTALASDSLIAYTTLTATRYVTLPAASAFQPGKLLWVVDESGACSASATITVNRAGADTIDGAASVTLNAAYDAVALTGNGSNKWTILADPPNQQFTLIGVGTAPDPTNTLAVSGAAALFTGSNFTVSINKSATANTASIIFEDAFSARAQMGLNGSDSYSFKVSPNGSSWTTALAFDPTTGAASFANQRTAVSDAAYAAQTTDRLIAYTALTAARVVTLPAASAFPPGQILTVVDEAGACSAVNTITLIRSGADAIDGAVSLALAAPYASISLVSNGAGKWTLVSPSGASASTPAMDGTAAAGAAFAYARADHVHPSDATRAALSGASFTGAVTLAAGAAALAPLKFQSGANLTSPIAGVMEYDGAVFYGTVAAGGRGVVVAEQIEVLAAPYTLTSQTAAQKLLNGTAAGALTLAAGAYEFECFFTLSALSSTSGSFGFALGGAATFTQSWQSTAAQVASPATAATAQITFNTAANAALTTASTSTNGSALIQGILRVAVAGTVVPQVSLGVAAPAIVGANSYFKVAPVGASGVTNVGNWS